MKTVLELLDAAPLDQVRRMQIAFKAIANGEWDDAAYTLRNAVQESTGSFASDCEELAEYCQRRARIVVAGSINTSSQ